MNAPDFNLFMDPHRRQFSESTRKAFLNKWQRENWTRKSSEWMGLLGKTVPTE